MTFEMQRWLKCPECGEDKNVGCRSYHAHFVVECYECASEADIEVGKRPLHKLRLQAVEEKLSH